MSIRPLHQSVRPSPIFLAIVSLTVVGGVLAWLAADNVRPLAYAGVFIFVIAGFLVSKRQKTLVSLAGPATNLAFAVVLLVLTGLLREPGHPVFWAAMAFLGFLQVTAFVLNILPVPGLDGYSALEPHLSPHTQRTLQPAKQWGFLVLLLLLFTPQLNRWFFEMVFWFTDLSGVPRGLVIGGMDLTRFWSAWF